MISLSLCTGPLPLLVLSLGGKDAELCLALRLFYGSPHFTIDLVAADSKEGSNPVVVGNIVQDTPSPRTPTGQVSNPLLDASETADPSRTNLLHIVFKHHH